MLPLYLAMYQDQISAVRAAAARHLPPLAATLGGGWARARLLPRLRELYTARDGSYMQRITVLSALKDFILAADAHDAANDSLDLLLAGLRDAVPNVRLVAAAVLRGALDAAVYDGARVAREIRPALEAAQTDADLDVRAAVVEMVAKAA